MNKWLAILFFFMLTSPGMVAQNSPLAQEQKSAELPDFKNNLKPSKINLYPNPANDFVTITITDKDLKSVDFEMYNIIGNKMKLELEPVSKNQYKLNVKEYNSGYYLLVVKDPQTRYSEAFKFQKK
jgi:hypothetical protein